MKHFEKEMTEKSQSKASSKKSNIMEKIKMNNKSDLSVYELQALLENLSNNDSRAYEDRDMSTDNDREV